jgi:hypothetical protein
MARKPLPPPEWFEEFRLLHVNYGFGYRAIRARQIPEAEKRALSRDLWFKTEANRKQLMKLAVTKLRCSAIKRDGERCSKSARPDFIGQMCSSHAPHIDEYPALEETRRLWLEHEYNQQAG